MQGKSEGDVDKAAALFSEIQLQLDAKQLKPFIRTQYMRSAFQVRGRAGCGRLPACLACRLTGRMPPSHLPTSFACPPSRACRWGTTAP